MIDKSILPAQWEVKKLGEVCEFEYGKALKKDIRDTSGEYDVYGSNGVVGKHSQFIVKDPCVIVGRKGAAGEVHLSLAPAWPIDTTYFVKQKPSYNLKFLYYQLRSLQLGSLDKSTAIPGLNRNDAYQKLFILPPLSEQQEIVAKIEELFSELDKGKEQLETARQQLKVYRQAVLKWAFEGKFTNSEVKDGELPNKWKWVKIHDFLNSSRKGMATGPFGTALKKAEHQSNGTPVLGIENIGEGVFKMPNKIFVTSEKAKELKSFEVIAEDIIISRSGTVGEICRVPSNMEGSIISTNLIRVKLNQDIISAKYFVYLFQGGGVRDQVKEQCKGSTRAFLNQTILSSLHFPLCSLAEQHKVVQEIESRLSVCDKVEETINKGLLQAETLRQSILKQAFEGKLVKAKGAKAEEQVNQFISKAAQVDQYQISFE